jgi:hypothetical protein
LRFPTHDRCTKGRSGQEHEQPERQQYRRAYIGPAGALRHLQSIAVRQPHLIADRQPVVVAVD